MQKSIFAVVSTTEAKKEEETLRCQDMAARPPEAENIRAQIDEALEQGDQETRARKDKILGNAAPTEVSPWLGILQWPRYLQGHSFDEIAVLTSPANLASEPLLV